MMLTEKLRDTVNLLRRRGSGIHAGLVEEAISELERLQWLANTVEDTSDSVSDDDLVEDKSVGTGADAVDNISIEDVLF